MILFEHPDIKTVYWLGIPYTIEKHYRRFFIVCDKYDTQIIDDVLIGKVLTKYFKIN